MTAQELAELRDKVTRARLEREKERTIAAETPRPAAIRYTTDAERVQARKRTWRLSKRRPCPGCGGIMSHPASKSCRRCYLAAVEPKHGTISRYISRKCRCVECREAASTYHRERRERMREWRVAA